MENHKKHNECCEEELEIKENNSHAHHSQSSGKEGHHTHHSEHSGHSAEGFRNRFFIALVLTLPIFLYSPLTVKYFKINLPDFPLRQVLFFILASIIVLYCGLPFHKGALAGLKAKKLGMNTLVSFALIIGYLYSVAVTFFIVGEDYYEAITTLAIFLLFGHWLEMRAANRTSQALDSLIKLAPDKAIVLKDGKLIEVKTSDLRVGDIIQVKPGERIPADGIVISGETEVDESMISGESKPVGKKPGNKVIGATINKFGSIQFKATGVGEGTVLSQMVKLVSRAQQSKPPTQRLADSAAQWLTVIAISIGLATFFIWLFLLKVPITLALSFTIAVIIITCPHALGLAIPVVVTVASGIAAKGGTLIKDAAVLEKAAKIDTVVFDKTGTLTEGKLAVTDVESFSQWNKEKILRVAASIEQKSEHSIAKAFLEKATDLENVEDFKAISGYGVKAKIGNQVVLLGNQKLMEENKIDLNPAQISFKKLINQGKTVIFLAIENKICGLVALTDKIKEESKEAVQALEKQGIEVAMITGDNQKTASYVAENLGIKTFFAEVLPEEKYKKIKLLQDKGKFVAMVGDGINDAPALTQANLGIAIGAGTDVAIESADLILVKSSPMDVLKIIKLSKRVIVKMKQNLFWAVAYNLIAIPVAAGFLFPRFGIVIKPEFAALIMSASSIIVVFNALLLKIKE